MNLHIIGKLPETANLIIVVNGEHYQLDSVRQEVIVSLSESKTYEVDVELSESKTSFNVPSILLFILTSLLQGIFHIIFMNTESDWYNDIIAYSLKAKLLIDVKEDTKINIFYNNAKYDIDMNRWSDPNLQIVPNMNFNVEYTPNINDFKNKWFGYVKKLISIVSVVLLLMVFLLHVAVTQKNIMAIIILGIIIFSAVALCLTLIYKEHKKLKIAIDSVLKK
jgi:hypothetical protein